MNVDLFSLVWEGIVVKVIDTISEPIFSSRKKTCSLIATDIDSQYDYILLLSSRSCYEAVNLILNWQDWVYYDVIWTELQDGILLSRGRHIAWIAYLDLVKNNFLTCCMVRACNIEPVGVGALGNGLPISSQIEMVINLISPDGLDLDFFPSTNRNSHL